MKQCVQHRKGKWAGLTNGAPITHQRYLSVTQAYRLADSWSMQCGQIGRQAVSSHLKHAVRIYLVLDVVGR